MCLINAKRIELSEDMPVWKFYNWDFAVGGILSPYYGSFLHRDSSECDEVRVEFDQYYGWCVNEAIHAYSSLESSSDMAVVNAYQSSNAIVCRGVVLKGTICYGNGHEEIAAQKVINLHPILIYIEETLSDDEKKEIIEGVCKHFNVKDIPIKYV